MSDLSAEKVVAELRDRSTRINGLPLNTEAADLYRRAADFIVHQAARLVEQAGWVTHWQTKCQATNGLLQDAKATLTAAEAEKERYRAAIEWALGEGDSDFGDNKPENAKPFWWRTELRRRAALSEKEQGDAN